MERFDPRTAGQSPVLASSGWTVGEARRGIFGDRAIGDLVRVIVGRLSEGAPSPSRQD
jgi:hypothetical protein